MRLSIHPEHPEPHKIARTVEILRRGGVIAYPTDTVYGLGCDIFDKRAVDRLYSIKRIDKDHPLAFVCPDLSDIARFAVVEDRSYRLMRRLLPGPYCFILPATREVPKIMMMKKKTIGIRVPKHAVAHALVLELGHPIVSTSATWQGEQLDDPADIADRFPGLDVILDAGWLGSVPSTVIDLTGPGPIIQRKGAGPVEDVA